MIIKYNKRKNTIKSGNARFTILSEYSFKAEYSNKNKFMSTNLVVTDINNINPVKYNVTASKSSLLINTGKIKIIYTPSKTGFTSKTLKVKYQYNSKIRVWYYNKTDTQNLGGSMLHLFKFPRFTKESELTDGVLSRSGFFAYYDTTNTYWNKKHDWVIQNPVKKYQTCFFIGYGLDFKTGLFEYSKIFGKPTLPPKWAFGFWYSRWHKYYQNDFINIVKKYRKNKMPIDVMVVDTDWRKNVWIGYDWNKKYFPNPKKFVNEMKKLNVKTTLNDHPGYGFSEPVPEDDTHKKDIEKYFNKKIKGQWKCNWSKQEDVNAFLECCIKPKLKLGVDFWWIDGWGADGVYHNEDYFDETHNKDPMSLGPRKNHHIELNPQLWLNLLYYKATQELHKNKRVLILSRWGNTGSHRYPLWFSGDTYSTWSMLAYQIIFTYTAGNTLTNFWSHDIGGFLGGKIPNELYIRWIQFGALSPIFRTHSSEASREPWIFGKKTVDIFRKYVQLRYSLIPYFYSAALVSYLIGLPIIRANYHNYPEYEESYKYKHQYFIGDSILVAPIVKSNRSKKYINKTVFFPDGEWYRLEKKEIIKGKTIQTVKVTIDEIPVFIKKGAIIPISLDNNHTDEIKRNYLHFEIFPNKKSEYIYYEDDGITNDYKKKQYIKIPVNVTENDNEIIITLGKMTGKYDGMYKHRKLTLIIHTTKKLMLDKQILKTTKIFNKIKSHYNSYTITTNYSGEKKVWTVHF